MATVGFLGAGQLGEPMVGRLLSGGRDVCVFARRAELRSRLRDRGATLAASVADLAACSDILILCLFSDAQINQTAWGSDGFLANAKVGCVVVSHTTGTVAVVKALASASGPAAIVDAPVSGTVDDIAEGRLTVLMGGDDDALGRVRDVVACYADPILATGALGSALTVKLINNVLFAANAQLVARALTVAEQFGLAPGLVLEALSKCSGASVASTQMQRLGGVRAFSTRATPFLRKDVAAALDEARDRGIDLGGLQLIAQSGPLPLGVSPP